MSAAARAEARRKAILARGNDRLAKLTTSARGEDNPVYMHDDPPLPSISRTSNFVGEETIMPTPPARVSPSPSPSAADTTRARNTSQTGPDPSVWSEEQQQQLMQALMGSMGGMAALPSLGGMGMNSNAAGQTGFDSATGSGVPPSLADNPLAAMLLGPQNGGAPPFMPPGMGSGKAPAVDGGAGGQTQTQTRLQRMMPLVHLVAVWGLLAFFVLYKEPQVHELLAGAAETSVTSVWSRVLSRWAELGSRQPQIGSDSILGQGWTVAVVPFFWAFITLQIVLHSLRIFHGYDRVQPPMLLAMALPHLPPPFPSIVVNGLKYLQLGSIFLDDLAVVVVGIGFLIWIAGLLSS